jgi:hypothetical protein
MLLKSVWAGTLAGVMTIAASADSAADRFAEELRRAVAADDRRAVAASVEYPMVVGGSGQTLRVTSAAAFEKMFDGIFTTTLRCALEHPAVVSGDAMSLADGMISAHQTRGSYRITRISSAAGRLRNPSPPAQRIALRAGARGMRTAQLAGRLSDGQSDTWIAPLLKGSVVEARIEGFAGNAAALRVVRPGSTTIAASAGRVARFTAPVNGDYTLKVVRLASACAPELTYRMTVNVR